MLNSKYETWHRNFKQHDIDIDADQSVCRHPYRIARKCSMNIENGRKKQHETKYNLR